MKKRLMPQAAAVIILLVTVSGCIPFLICRYPVTMESYPFRFSVNNKTNSDILAELVIGEIPAPNAAYQNFVPIPDYVYQLTNESYTAETGTKSVIKAKKNNFIYTLLPINSLPMGSSEDEIRKELQKLLLNKLISFTLTLSCNGEIIYRVAGWNLPKSEWEENHINDTQWGYYDTAEPEGENWIDQNGNTVYLPQLYTKWQENGPCFPFEASYFINAAALDDIYLQEFLDGREPYWSDDDYWRKH
jgi:hypothetical protein